jgi:hypothetical protein
MRQTWANLSDILIYIEVHQIKVFHYTCLHYVPLRNFYSVWKEDIYAHHSCNRHCTEAVHTHANDYLASDSRGKHFLTGVAPSTSRASDNLHRSSYNARSIYMKSLLHWWTLFEHRLTVGQYLVEHWPMIDRCLLPITNPWWGATWASMKTSLIFYYNSFSPDDPNRYTRWPQSPPGHYESPAGNHTIFIKNRIRHCWIMCLILSLGLFYDLMTLKFHNLKC